MLEDNTVVDGVVDSSDVAEIVEEEEVEEIPLTPW
jgi:hypothetical protein